MTRIKKESHSSNLLNALGFVALAGAEYCSIGDGFVSAFTDSVCMGHPIEEDLNAQAHIKNLYQSLHKSNEKTAITQLDLHKLHVNSGELQVYIPCSEKIHHVKPDEFGLQIDNKFLVAMEKILSIVSTFGDNVSTRTILCNKQSMFATNRFILVESWSGLDLPFCNMTKKFCQLVLKTKKEPVGFGYSPNSITIYFNDSSWIMGRNSQDEWINPYSILDVECNYQQLSDELKTALKTIPSFSDSGMVYCVSGCLQSHQEAQQGASYPVPGLPDGRIFGVKEMNYLSKHALEVDFSKQDTIYFWGRNLRGAISSRKV